MTSPESLLAQIGEFVPRFYLRLRTVKEDGEKVSILLFNLPPCSSDDYTTVTLKKDPFNYMRALLALQKLNIEELYNIIAIFEVAYSLFDDLDLTIQRIYTDGNYQTVITWTYNGRSTHYYFNDDPECLKTPVSAILLCRFASFLQNSSPPGPYTVTISK